LPFSTACEVLGAKLEFQNEDQFISEEDDIRPFASSWDFELEQHRPVSRGR
jgi:hypothetical protein